MSLKAFHLFFVAICIVFCGGFGYWAVRQGMAGDTGSLALGIASWAVAVALVPYSGWVLVKLKDVGFF